MLPEVMAECRDRAVELQAAGAPRFRWMGMVVILLWITVLALLVFGVLRLLSV